MALIYLVIWPLKLFIRRIVWVSREPLPSPLIVAANHESPLDPILLMLVLRRRIRFVASGSLRTGPFWKRWWFGLTVFALGKSVVSGNHGVEQCKEILSHGETVGLFLQGDIHPALAKNRIHTGTIVLSRICRTQILPVRISGSDGVFPIIGWPLRFWRFRSITISIGALSAAHTNNQLSREKYQQEASILLDHIQHL